jgi:peptide-methionine (S)-S-oxide reductase
MRYYSLTLLVSLLLASCSSSELKASENQSQTKVKKNLSKYQKAYFASGCFWCVEAVFESVKGVEEVISGYAGGDEVNPTYQQVSAGLTGHAEVVEVYYDSTVVSYETLLTAFFDSHDPTTLNRQGPDAGTQYRSAIFYEYEYQKTSAEVYIKRLLEKRVFSTITTEIAPLKKFYVAEDYHQDYEKLNPDNPYVNAVSIPRLKKFKKKRPELLKD